MMVGEDQRRRPPERYGFLTLRMEKSMFLEMTEYQPIATVSLYKNGGNMRQQVLGRTNSLLSFDTTRTTLI
jgi:hypothetical protein